MNGAPEITVLQLPKFKTEATELIGAEGIQTLAIYLTGHPDAGSVIPGSGGVRKLRWAAKGKGKRSGARIIYLYDCGAHLPGAVLREECQTRSDNG
jgi:hypothetical protein